MTPYAQYCSKSTVESQERELLPLALRVVRERRAWEMARLKYRRAKAWLDYVEAVMQIEEDEDNLSRGNAAGVENN